MAKVAEIEAAEREKMRAKVAAIIGHGINVFVNRQLIYNFPEELFADAGVCAVEHADFDGIERLALVTGGEIASTFDDAGRLTLGSAALVEEIMVGDDRMIHFSGCARAEACSIVLRGASMHVLDEAERSLHDALCVVRCLLQKRFLVPGGGAPEAGLSWRLAGWAKTLGGMEAYCAKAFADALEVIPYTLAENAGLNPIEVVTELRNRHARGQAHAGINVRKGGVTDMLAESVVQPLLVTTSALRLSTECVRMILKIDDIVPTR